MTSTPTNDRKARALALLDAADAAGEMYNPTYKDAKDLLNRALEEAAKAVENTLDRSQYDAMWEYGLHASNFTLHRLPLQRKNLDKARQKGVPFDYAAFDALIADWMPIYDRIEAWKPLVKSGRRILSPEERSGTVRTLDNTGTCACCRNNIKLKNDRMVDHGFRISDGFAHYFGFRSGNCFGVGYLPWEVSTEGAVALVKSMQTMLTDTVESLFTLDDRTEFYLPDHLKTRQERNTSVIVKPEDGRFLQAKDDVRRELEMQRDHLQKSIAYYELEINNWKPGTLPGTKAREAQDGGS